MQKTTQHEHSERNSEPAGEPLDGSGFEQEQTDPEFSGDSNNEEANAK